MVNCDDDDDGGDGDDGDDGWLIYSWVVSNYLVGGGLDLIDNL